MTKSKHPVEHPVSIFYEKSESVASFYVISSFSCMLASLGWLLYKELASKLDRIIGEFDLC